MRKHVNVNWNVPDRLEWQHVSVTILMDIRDELQTLNRLLRCPNFLSMPQTLRNIQRSTAKKRVKRKSRIGK